METEKTKVIDVALTILIIGLAYKIGTKKGYYDGLNDVLRVMEFCERSQK